MVGFLKKDLTCGPVLAEREREGELRGSGLARRLLGWSFPGRPSSCPFFICFFFYFLSCLFDLFETKLIGFD
jgi:hypothetical protein